MKSKRIILFRLAAVALLAVIAALMLVIGRGHTVYLDNKTLEDYNGQTYKAFHKVVVTVKGEQVARLDQRDRGMSTWIGQNFKMTLEITPEKGAESEIHEINLKLPYGMDGVIVNLPAVLAGLPEDAWLTEFIPAPEEPSAEDTEIPGEGDEFGLGGDMGLEEDIGF